MEMDATQAIWYSDDETEEESGGGAERKPVAYLHVLAQKDAAVTEYPIYEGENSIGRHESNSVHLAFKALSKQHACIEVQGDIHLIHDLESRNKTRRGKMFLKPSVRYELKEDDTLIFGDVKCQYRLCKDEEDVMDSGSDTDSELMLQPPENESPGLDAKTSQEPTQKVLTDSLSESPRPQQLRLKTPRRLGSGKVFAAESDEEESPHKPVKGGDDSFIPETQTSFRKKSNVSAVGESDYDTDIDETGPFDISALAAPTQAVNNMATQAVDNMATQAVDNMATQALDTMETQAVDNMATQAVDNMATQAVDNIATQAVDNIATQAVDTMATQAVDTIETQAVDNMATQAFDNMATQAVDNMATQAVDNMATQAIDTMATQAVDNIATQAVDTNATQAVDNMETQAVDNMATQAVDTMVTQAVDTMATQAVDNMATQAVDTMATQAVDNMVTQSVDTMATQAVDNMATQAVDDAGSDFDVDNVATLAVGSDDMATQAYEPDMDSDTDADDVRQSLMDAPTLAVGLNDCEEEETSKKGDVSGPTLRLDSSTASSDEDSNTKMPFGARSVDEEATQPCTGSVSDSGSDTDIETDALETQTLAVVETIPLKHDDIATVPLTTSDDDDDTNGSGSQGAVVDMATVPVTADDDDDTDVEEDGLAGKANFADEPTQAVSPGAVSEDEEEKEKDGDGEEKDDINPALADEPTQAVDMVTDSCDESGDDAATQSQEYFLNYKMGDEEKGDGKKNIERQGNLGRKAHEDEDELEIEATQAYGTSVEEDAKTDAVETPIDATQPYGVTTEIECTQPYGATTEIECTQPYGQEEKEARKDDNKVEEEIEKTVPYGEEDVAMETDESQEGSTQTKTDTQVPDSQEDELQEIAATRFPVFNTPSPTRSCLKQTQQPERSPTKARRVTFQPSPPGEEEGEGGDQPEVEGKEEKEAESSAGRKTRGRPSLQASRNKQAGASGTGTGTDTGATTGASTDTDTTTGTGAGAAGSASIPVVQSEGARTSQRGNRKAAPKEDETPAGRTSRGRPSQQSGVSKETATPEGGGLDGGLKKAGTRVSQRGRAGEAAKQEGAQEIPVPACIEAQTGGGRRGRPRRAARGSEPEEGEPSVPQEKVESGGRRGMRRRGGKEEEETDGAKQTFTLVDAAPTRKKKFDKAHPRTGAKSEGERKMSDSSVTSVESISSVKTEGDGGGQEEKGGKLKALKNLGRKLTGIARKGKQSKDAQVELPGAGLDSTTVGGHQNDADSDETGSLSSTTSSLKDLGEMEVGGRPTRSSGRRKGTDQTDCSSRTPDTTGAAEEKSLQGDAKGSRSGRLQRGVVEEKEEVPGVKGGRGGRGQRGTRSRKTTAEGDDKEQDSGPVVAEKESSEEQPVRSSRTTRGRTEMKTDSQQSGGHGTRSGRSQRVILAESSAEPQSARSGRTKITAAAKEADAPGKGRTRSTDQIENSTKESDVCKSSDTETPKILDTSAQVKSRGRGKATIASDGLEEGEKTSGTRRSRRATTNSQEESDSQEGVRLKGDRRRTVEGTTALNSGAESSVNDDKPTRGGRKSARQKVVEEEGAKTGGDEGVFATPQPVTRTARQKRQRAPSPTNQATVPSDGAKRGRSSVADASLSSLSKKKEDARDAPSSEKAAKRGRPSVAKGLSAAATQDSGKSESEETKTTGRSKSGRNSAAITVTVTEPEQSGSSRTSRSKKEETEVPKPRAKRGAAAVATPPPSPSKKARLASLAPSPSSASSPSSSQSASPSPRQRGRSNQHAQLGGASPSLRKRGSEVKPKVMFTGVMDPSWQKTVTTLGGELVDSVHDCTHLITDKVRRTVKFLCCLSRGVTIITPDWIEKSKSSKTFVDPSPYQLKDRGAEKQYGFSLSDSLLKASASPLLTGYRIHVTKGVKPDSQQMKDIIKCAGAEFLSRTPSQATPQTVVVSCEADKQLWAGLSKAGLPVLSTEFILTGILKQEILLKQYKLK